MTSSVENLEDRTLLATATLSAGGVLNVEAAAGEENDLEIDVRYDASGVDGAGLYLQVEEKSASVSQLIAGGRRTAKATL